MRGGAAIVVVSNIDIPNGFRDILINNGIELIKEDFDLFRFKTDKLWYLAFYKLCALYKMCRKYEYDNYCYLDTDVYIQHSFDPIWRECSQNILLYDINHGLQVKDYTIIVEELTKYYGEEKYIIHFGGEFFASNKENAIAFSNECLKVFNQMVSKNIETTKGDEYILSIAADLLKNRIKNAGAYIYRYWTGLNFRLTSTNFKYNEVCVLHMPNEKEKGIKKLYRFIVSRNKIPKNKKVWTMCRIVKPGFIDYIDFFIHRIKPRRKNVKESVASY